MIQPLSGVQVLDFTHGFAGPMCGYHLGLLGADVLKIERPITGDNFRERGAVFDAANAGKRSLVVDITRPGATEQIAQLVGEADIVLHNFRPSVAERIGLTPERVLAVNPAVVLCTITGFGLRGAWADRPAIEWTAQAASGLMASYVDLADHDQLGVLMLDPFTAVLGVQSILAAWISRTATGEGVHVDVSLLDTALLAQTGAIPDAARGAGRGRLGHRPGVGRFQARDGMVYIGAVTPVWQDRVFDALGIDPTLLQAAREADDVAAAMRKHIEDAAHGQSAATVAEMITAVGVPAAAVDTLADVLAPDHPLRPHLSLETVTDSGGEELTLVGSAVRFNGESLSPRGPAPELGEFDAEYDHSER